MRRAKNLAVKGIALQVITYILEELPCVDKTYYAPKLERLSIADRFASKDQISNAE